MADPDPAAQLDIPQLVARIEARLLGGAREYTRADAAKASGLEPEATRRLWQALGFAIVGDDERAFTDGDIDALENVRRLGADLSIDDAMMRAITRMLGRSFSRLASWQGQLLVEMISESPELLQSEDQLFEFLDQLLPTIEKLHSYVWRRQLAAYLGRVTSGAEQDAEQGGESGAESTMTVGFADMAQFTAFTRRSSEAELSALLDEFESVTTEIVGSHRGQIVKTIGDEILFVADDVDDAAEIALALLEAADDSAILPQLRAGLARGPVVSRLGDVFGQPVNIASRLTTLARTDSILVDDGMSQALAGHDGYRLSSLRPASVRGYHHLRSWRLRRSAAG